MSNVAYVVSSFRNQVNFDYGEHMILFSFDSNLELKLVGTLDVKLVQPNNLANKDLIVKFNPYVVIFVRPLRDKTKTSKTIVRHSIIIIIINLFIIHALICNPTIGYIQRFFQFKLL